MATLFLETARLSDGWANNVHVAVDRGGFITQIAADQPRATDAELISGAAIPGAVNLHSHAFQRAMAGLAEYRSASADDFWSWRDTMYRFVDRLTPYDIRVIATQLYIEMIKSGYSAVAEFHYLHNDPLGQPYADAGAMSAALLDAASAAGIGITLAPVLYSASGFGGQAPEPAQRRFILDTEQYLTLHQQLAGRIGADPDRKLATCFHSLRAVTLDQIRAVLEATDGGGPIHIHIAEQTREVADCLAWCQSRPVEFLAGEIGLTPDWCLVHATHMTPDETKTVAGSGAVVALCPSTEGNLGDGFFPLDEYLAAGGAFGIGSDSHVSVSPVEELRWLDYGRRLRTHRRMPANRATGQGLGDALWTEAASHGERASGRKIGKLAVGYRADIVVLDRLDPTIVAREGAEILDSFVFSGQGSAVRDVMIGGRWVLRDRHHANEAEASSSYRNLALRLARS
jgi:formimidoylglutamate deiminase